MYSALRGETADLGYRTWWDQVEAAVGTVLVVVAQIFGQDAAQVVLTVDEHSVGQFGAQRADPAFRAGVRPRASWWSLDDLDARAGEDGVERIGELSAAITQQDRKPVRTL